MAYAERVLSGRGSVSSWQSPWLLNRTWDLTYISLSVILVPTPFILFAILQRTGILVNVIDSSAAVDIIVALIVGGPHMTSTYTLTFLDRNFTRRHPTYVALAFVLPVMVTFLGIVNLPLLVTIFMLWASVHVLHQIAYITDCYRTKGSDFHSLFSRAIDYGVIFSSLYPLAMIKLVENRFVIGGTHVTIPLILNQYYMIYLANIVFACFLTLFVAKTYLEYQQRRANFPKTLLVAITVGLCYIIPTADNLDVAFQGMNVWHSVQYLGLTWYLNSLRQQHGAITSPVVDRISGPKRGPLYYLFNLALTLGAGAMVILLYLAFHVSWIQSYYIVILSCLLIHYYFDHFMFMKVGELVGSET
jgi:hypothetical protein